MRQRLYSDARKLVDPGSLRLFLAIQVPGDEEKPAKDDDQGRTHADSEPDPIEDQNDEHPEEQESDRRTRQLEAVASPCGESTTLRGLVASGGRTES